MKYKLFTGVLLCTAAFLASCGGGDPAIKESRNELDNYIVDTGDASSLSVQKINGKNRLMKTTGDETKEITFKTFLDNDKPIKNSDYLTAFSIDDEAFIEYRVWEGLTYSLSTLDGTELYANLVDNGEYDYNDEVDYCLFRVPELGVYKLNYEGNYTQTTLTQDNYDGEIDRLYTFPNEHYSIISVVAEGTSARESSTDKEAYDRGKYFTGPDSTVYIINNANGVVNKLELIIIDSINEDGTIQYQGETCNISFTPTFTLQIERIIH